MIYEGNFAGYPLRYRFRYPGTEKYMRSFLREIESDEWDIMATEAHIDWNRPFYPENQEDQYVEYKSLIELTSRALLPQDRCIIHATAFLWQGRAWLLTGPSGIGKTTQYKNWKRLYRGEVRIICGDMPILEHRPDDTFFVHPSPWNGKERLKGSDSAPLGGIIILEQAEENHLRQLTPNASAVPLFLQLAALPENEKQLRQMTDFSERLLGTCPVWQFQNRGDLESTRHLAGALQRYLGEEEPVSVLHENDSDEESIISKNFVCRNSMKPEETADEKSPVFPAGCTLPENTNPGEDEKPKDNVFPGNGSLPQGPEQPQTFPSNKSENTMKYIARKGILPTTVGETNILVSAKALPGQVPYVTEINDTTAFCWELLMKGASEDELTRALLQEFEGADESLIRADICALLQQLEEQGYILPMNKESNTP